MPACLLPRFPSPYPASTVYFLVVHFRSLMNTTFYVRYIDPPIERRRHAVFTVTSRRIMLRFPPHSFSCACEGTRPYASRRRPRSHRPRRPPCSSASPSMQRRSIAPDGTRSTHVGHRRHHRGRSYVAPSFAPWHQRGLARMPA
jgi:hypothetical protein